MAYPIFYTFIALAFYAEIAFADTCNIQCRGDGLYPHPTDCTKFCHCAYGTPFENNCVKGLHFDRYKLECLWPNEAHCFTQRSYQQCKLNCPKDNGLFPHPTDCGKFCQCSNGIPYEQGCDPGLHFNPKTQRCDYPKDAGCVTPRSLKRCKINCPKDNGLFPHPTACWLFCQCSNGIPIEQECSAGLHFNPNKQECDYPKDAGCVTPRSHPQCKINCRQDNGLYPHPTDCFKYCHCSNGIPYEQACNAGLHFNAREEKCDYPYNADCADGKCKRNCPADNGLFPHPTVCWKFCHCSNGIPYEQGCSAGLHYNPNKKECDYPLYAGCE